MVINSNEPESIKVLLTAADVARRLKISRALAYQLMQTGEIHTVRIRNKLVRVYEPDLEDYILKCRTTTSAYGC
jgi:excisionase family DNA binding protein